MTKCKLCNIKKQLINKSHIYPDFVYSDLYDEHHKLRKFNVADMQNIDPRISKPASGIYEGNLLCSDCDGGKIGKLESYVASLIKGRDKNVSCNTVHAKDETKIIEVENLKYKEFKKFHFISFISS